MIYVAVGFKINSSRSIFYVKEKTLDDFLASLEREIKKKSPDFVSLRFVREFVEVT